LRKVSAVDRTAFREKQRDFNRIKAAVKLLQRAEMGRHTEVLGP